MPFNSKDLNKKNEKITESSTSDQNDEKPKKDNKNESNSKPYEKIESTMMIGTPFFFSNMPKYYYYKSYKRKSKPFTEREGDWVCHYCKNLNFSFRVECNRCKKPKRTDAKTDNNEDNSKENNQEQKTYQQN